MKTQNKKLKPSRRLLSKYKQFLQNERQNSSQTVFIYLNFLTLFRKYCRKKFKKEMQGIKIEELREYINDSGKTLKTASMKRNVTILRMFYEWLSSVHNCNELINDNFSKNIKITKILKYLKGIIYKKNDFKLPQILTAEEIEKIREYLTMPQDIAFFELLINTGLRRKEITGIRVGNIDLEKQEIVIKNGKGDRERIVPFDDRTKIALTEHLDNCSLLYSDKLFNGGFSYKNIYAKIHSWARGAGIERNIYPHLFRHTRITALVKNAPRIGLSLTEISLISGCGIKTLTNVYTHLNMDPIKEKLALLEI